MKQIIICLTKNYIYATLFYYFKPRISFTETSGKTNINVSEVLLSDKNKHQ